MPDEKLSSPPKPEPRRLVLLKRNTGDFIEAWVNEAGDILAWTPLALAPHKISEMLSHIGINGAGAPTFDLNAILVDENGHEVQTIIERARQVGSNPRDRRADVIAFAAEVSRVALGVTASSRRPWYSNVLKEMASDPMVRMVFWLMSLWMLQNFHRFSGTPLPVPVKVGGRVLRRVPTPEDIFPPASSEQAHKPKNRKAKP